MSSQIGVIVAALISAAASIYVAERGARQGRAKDLNHPIQERAKSRKVSISFFLGLIGLVAWYLPILGLPITLVSIGIGLSDLAGCKGKRLTVAGIYLSLLGLMASVGNSAIGAYRGWTGEL